MRHLMLALMIVLLPLRGWAGDSMATEMAAGTASASMSAGAQAHHDPAPATEHAEHTGVTPDSVQALHDCAGHAHQDDQAAPGSTAAHDGYCSTCGACQACHTVALSPTADQLNIVFSIPAMRQDLSASFTSASTALSQKPPIS